MKNDRVDKLDDNQIEIVYKNRSNLLEMIITLYSMLNMNEIQ